MAGIRDTLASLLGVSTFERPPSRTVDSATIKKVRQDRGGSIVRQSTTQTRWYMADLEDAVRMADSGNLKLAARLWKAMRRDGVMSGLLSTCTDGLVRLPKRFFGDAWQVELLQARNGTRSIFDEMFPASELALLAADGRGLGVGVAELLPVKGRDFPVMVRLDPEWLVYEWQENRWYYDSAAGRIPITPGDGRWILHLPGGRMSPWQHGQWQALGRAWISKEHALQYRTNWESKLANPARVAVAPNGATEEEQQTWFESVMAWGVNTVFGMRPGYDVRLLESNGRGYESFSQTIETANNEMMIALAGQVVTTTGGAGFANSDIHKSIRADIIKAIADSLAYTINTQGIPVWVVNQWGAESLNTRATVEWDVEPAKDRLQEANAMIAFANAIKGLRESLAPYQRDVDVVAIANAHGIPVVEIARPVEVVPVNDVQEAA